MFFGSMSLTQGQTSLLLHHLFKIKTQGWELLGVRHRGNWRAPHRQIHMPQLVADQSFAGSSVSAGLCSLLIAQISENESQRVQASGADEICRGQLAEKSFQKKTRTSNRWKSGKLIEMFPGEGKGEAEQKPSFLAQYKRTLKEQVLERRQIF